MLPKQTIVEALTDRNIRERKSYNVRTAPHLDSYSTVCGTTAPITAHNSVTRTGSDLVDTFMGQIGCPGDDPHTWESRQAHYRAQFDKARQCFRGRVDAMKAYNANTPEEKEARASHAFAAQAAYTIGRDCLRKISDVLGAEDAYRASAIAHINEASAVKPNIKEALTDAGDGTLEAVIRANPYLGPLYAKDYGMSEEQWAIYHSFLRFSTLKASNYANTDGLRAKAMRAYQAMINPASVGGGGAATGGAGTGMAAIPVTPVVNVNSVKTVLAEKAGGLTLGGTPVKGAASINENALLEKAIEETKEAKATFEIVTKMKKNVFEPILDINDQNLIITSLEKYRIGFTSGTFTNIMRTVNDTEKIKELSTSLLTDADTLSAPEFVCKYIIPYNLLAAIIEFALKKLKFLKAFLRVKTERRIALTLRIKDETESKKSVISFTTISEKIQKFESFINTKMLQPLTTIIGTTIMKVPNNKKEIIKQITKFLDNFDFYNRHMTDYLIDTQKKHIETIGWKQLYPFVEEKFLDTSDTDESGLLGNLVRLYREVRALP